MTHQFRFIGTKNSDGHWVISDVEAHHLKKVLRVPSGASVELADGRGNVSSVVVEYHGTKITFIEQSAESYPLPKNKLAVAVSFQNKKYFSDVISPLVELGFDDVCFYSQAQTPKHFFDAKHQTKLKEGALSAFKQSKRRFFCNLHFVDDLVGLAKTYPACYLFDHIQGSDQKITELKLAASNLLIIGSELGHDQNTQTALQKLPHVMSLKLLDETLRATTATVSISSWFAFLRYAGTI